MKVMEPPRASALVREAALDLAHLLGQHVNVGEHSFRRQYVGEM